MHLAANEDSVTVNHVFVDYENVHAFDPAIIGTKTVRFTLLLGPKQAKLDVPLVEMLLKHAASVELVRLASSGKNAVDFAVAYYVGRATIQYPAGHFHIISKDTGFDPLVEHLRSKSVRIRRHDGFETLAFGPPARPAAAAKSPPAIKAQPAAKPAQSPAGLDERAMLMLEHLRKHVTNRPKREVTLIKHVIAHFGHKLSETEATGIIGTLAKGGHLAINDKGQVNYWLEEH